MLGPNAQKLWARRHRDAYQGIVLIERFGDEPVSSITVLFGTKVGDKGLIPVL